MAGSPDCPLDGHVVQLAVGARYVGDHRVVMNAHVLDKEQSS